MSARIVNYLLSRSPLLWYPKDLVLDVIMNRIRIYVQFDLDAFFRIAAQRNLELSFIVGKEAEERQTHKGLYPHDRRPQSLWG
jgi:hypothetical protein